MTFAGGRNIIENYKIDVDLKEFNWINGEKRNERKQRAKAAQALK